MKPPVEHVCPGCGRSVGSTRHQRATVGRPFDECPHCRTFVSRAPFNEWALMSSRDKLAILGLQGFVAVVLGLVPAALALVTALAARRELEPLTLLVVAAVGLVVSVGTWVSRMAYKLHRSARRMSDPWYQARLVQFAIEAERGRGASVGPRDEERRPEAGRGSA